jgi:alpha-aminoadipate carrier protein LysW
VVHCPKCGVEIDLDEDEVEEGEIVTCVECEAEMEIVQTHPVSLNIISEDDDDDEEEAGDADDDDDDEDDDDDDDDDDEVDGDDEEEPA